MKFVDSSGSTNYEIPLSNGLLTPEHVKRMGAAGYLFFSLEDRVTAGEGEDGIVAGGRPVLDRDLAEQLGKSEKTIARYRARLVGAYIVATRTMYGYTYRVLKSKKWAVISRVRSDKSVRSRSDTNVREIGHMCPVVKGNVFMTTAEEAAAKKNAAAAFTNLEPWVTIGLERPMGHKDFQQLWEESFKFRDAQPLSHVAKTCVDAWQRAGGTVPGPFFAALSRLRDAERKKQGYAAGRPTSSTVTVNDIVPRER